MILQLFNTILYNHSKIIVVRMMINLLSVEEDFLLKLLVQAILLHMCLLVLHCLSLDVTL